MTNNFPFIGVVLNGGRSERMGADKANLAIGEETLLELTVSRLRKAFASSIFIVGKETVGLLDAEVNQVTDIWPGEGPLGGILTALQSIGESDVPVMILACDFPNLDVTEIRSLVEYAYANPDSIVVPSVKGRKQWMHACWPTTVEEHLQRSFARGERAPHRALEGLRVVVVERSTVDAYVDIDTPEEFEEAKSSFKEQDEKK
ncbi:MAG: putative molybdenum cofactor guanylyltransferase [Acidimicrobiales bacterium AG-410-I20]|nr:MAG: putative molybdenum cofactor guanylyltransferase [Acidimicrobiales bacterium AG-410-I20]